ncbi:MAG: M20 family peptidase, partial [Gammaproteobacteria bacterium]|nr:M20 family peptidase [Gammaproteobacteria bacterium]
MTKTFRAHIVTAFALLSVSTSAMSSGLNADEQRMMAWIDANTENAIGLLAETVNISSGTMNPEGVRAVGKVMAREL